MVRRITVVSVAVILAAALSAAAQSGRESVPEGPLPPVPYRSAQSQSISISSRTIEVTGHGHASAKPDTMMVSFMLTDKADSSAECMRAHSGKMRKIIDALKAKLGSGSKITTSQFSLNPNYTTQPPVASRPEAAKPEWECKIDVSAYAPSISQIGGLIDAGMAAGATSVVSSGFLFLPKSKAAASTGGAGFVGRPTSFMGPGIAMQPMSGTTMPAVTLEVDTRDSTAQQATRRASAIAAKVADAFKQKLQGKGYVRVSEFNIVSASQNWQPQPAPRPQTPRITSWTATTMITARTHDLSILGPLIETGMKTGATGLNSVTFTLKKGNSARKQALENASADAKRKAATVARSMGVKLGNILKITTSAYAQPRIVYGGSFRTFLGQESPVGENRQMPVMPDEILYSATVNVTYQIK